MLMFLLQKLRNKSPVVLKFTLHTYASPQSLNQLPTSMLALNNVSIVPHGVSFQFLRTDPYLDH